MVTQTLSIPEYVTNNIRIEGGVLYVDPKDTYLTVQERRELNVIAYAFSYARNHGFLWDENNLEDARNFAAHVLIPDYALTRGSVVYYPVDVLVDRFEITENMAKYRRLNGRALRGVVRQLSQDEIKTLNKELQQ